MKDRVIKLLDEVHMAEVTAIHQYMAHHYSLDAMGYPTLAEKEKKLAIEEMKHAEVVGERILFYDGSPTHLPKPEIKKGGDIKKMLKDDIELEKDAIARLQAHIKELSEIGDFTSKTILEKILSDEEEHLDYLETELEKIETLGDAYLAVLGK